MKKRAAHAALIATLLAVTCGYAAAKESEMRFASGEKRTEGIGRVADDADAAVRRVIEKYVSTREAGDAKALAALFTDDVDQLVSTGEWRRGRDEVVRGTLASSQSASGKRTITVETVRSLSADVAVVDGRYEIAASGSSPARRMWTCFLLKRAGSDWRIAAIRNMLPAPAAAR